MAKKKDNAENIAAAEERREVVASYIKSVESYLRKIKQFETIDKAVIRNLSESYMIILMAQEAIEEHGILMRNSSGELVQNKAFKIKVDATIRFEKCLEILGIQGKQRYKDVENVKEEEPTALDKFINAKSKSRKR